MRPAVLITGGAKRIGAGIAQRFSAAGWHVVIHYQHGEAEAAALAETLPSAETIACDLGDGVAARAMIGDLAGRLDDWRCLISNAAVFAPDTAAAIDPAVAEEAFQVNAATPVLLAQAFFAYARSQAGRRLIQITDMKLANLNPDFFSYTMSKAAVDCAAQMLAMAVRGAAAGHDKVYRIAPGAILPSHDQSGNEAEESHLLNLLQRRTGADEVADAALFLAEGQLANGSVLYVDSGQHLLRQPRDVIYLAREGHLAHEGRAA